MNTSKVKISNWRVLLLFLLSVTSLIYIFSKPIQLQDPLYHDFADKRPIIGINNSFDVLSNIPFLLVGVYAIVALSRKRKSLTSFFSWLTFFVGVALVAPGSAYYHYSPNNSTLVWDRLPMTISFMGLFVAMISEYVDVRFEKFLFLFILLGFFSVGVWDYTQDLRLYYWVQAFPLLCIPIVMLLFKSQYNGKWLLLVGLVFYILAKITEFNDDKIFISLGQLVSGHTLKHLLAACGPMAIFIMLDTRKSLNS